MLPLAAVARPAKYSWVALPIMANAPDVTTRLVGKEHVATEIDGLPRTLETAAKPSKGSQVHAGIDGHQHIGVFRDGFVRDERADERNPQDARTRTRRAHKCEHSLKQVPPRIRNGRLRPE